MKFTKMHGIGNDYVYVNCFEENVDNPAQTAIAVSDSNGTTIINMNLLIISFLRLQVR